MFSGDPANRMGRGTVGSKPVVRTVVTDPGPWGQKNPRPASRSGRLDAVGRGCVKYTPDCNREPGFFAIAVEKFFSFRADWHQDDRARPLVRHYQTALDAALRSRPQLQGCLASCAHCGIRFLTHPRNTGRRDLRCPFGCRRHHRRQRSSQRSTAYYQTAGGRRKKKRLNGRRQRPDVSPAAPLPRDLDLPEASPDPRPASGCPGAPPTSDASPGTVELRLEGVVLDESSLARSPMLPYVRMIVSLIEGVRLSCREVLDLLRQAMRQHSFGARRRIDYLLGFLHRHPP